MKKKIPFVLFVSLFGTLVSCKSDPEISATTKPSASVTQGGSNENTATITSHEIVSNPLKTEYLPGDKFDPSGLVVKVTFSNGKTKRFVDTDFTEYTHKDQPLTTDVNKITFTVPGYTYTFDVAITVCVSQESSLELDLTAIKRNTYYSDEAIDFTKIVVRVKNGDNLRDLSLDQWKLFDGEAEITERSNVTLTVGEHTLTIKYETLTKNFTLNIQDKEQAIYPAVIEAEDSAYRYQVEDNTDARKNLKDFKETNQKFTANIKTFSAAEWKGEDGKYPDSNNSRILDGSSSLGAVDGLGKDNDNYYWKTVFFKFDVTVPADGEYDLFARGQTTNRGSVQAKDLFSYSVNGEKGTFTKEMPAQTQSRENPAYTATYEYEYTQSASTDLFTPGNQLNTYYGVPVGWQDTTLKAWYDTFWWNDAKVATFSLKKGTNTIRLMRNNPLAESSLALDYFSVVKKDSLASDVKILSTRNNVKYTDEGQPTRNRLGESMVTIGEDDTIYLSEGEKLSTISRTPADHPCHYSLRYLRLPDGKNVPITDENVTGIDYTKKGENTATVTVKSPLNNGAEIDGETQTYTAQFKVTIK